MASKNTQTPSGDTNGGDRDDGLKIIHAGLYRTGTASMSQAYRTLGYKSHHALDGVWTVPWGKVEQAAEATWPHLAKLPDYTYKHPDGSATPRPPFTRADWQDLWGQYDVVTDVACAFTFELIKAYPEAKVVIVERKFETWWPSFKSELLDSLYDITWLQAFLMVQSLRLRAPKAMHKIHAGFFNTHDNSRESIERRARDAYEEYYRKVREVVLKERRLEYKLGDGWEPLCEFLGKDIPDVEFPRINDRESHAAELKRQRRDVLSNILKVVGPVVAVAAAVGAFYLRW
ncbi:hypothetical protein HZS61_004957 [Fusarium oxysporum f. sp. conglutinans]|uniref:NAD dependent epimerase/dehydratase n=2 Tax=Fusarium oxysporum f. sp. conglutinans TaxID=100902 RepID=A0A8H6GCA0_FUSOX|nr:hypothetical protein FOXB_02874 [Fusarium oxysporum f. sp. conglutinans Fo5176]KAF6515051.1 hypothetical protein HZS61_004957 [Fusarium oxysporum f. sp. conglutinans]KAG6979056.1 hypothetical protein FocnCong_v011024 [Fusarium oxysporum f. sp. conglutinans]KAI8401190.1 hypothetical protein FOFC_18059 [Fusarium oxysporum]